jgi:RiboL-PSP-HEPN
MSVIKCFEFVNRLSDISVFIDHSLSGLEHKEVRDEALKRWMKGVPELIRDKKLYEKYPTEEMFRDLEKRMAESFSKKFDKSGLLILNMSLVMLCTIFEVFLDHMLKVIFDANPKTLLGISPYKNITLEEFLKFKDYSEILEDFKHKFLEHFNRQGIDKKLETLYSLGLKKEVLFSWRIFDEEARKGLGGNGDKRLVQIFNKRHSVVHNDALPLTFFEELLEIKDFLTKVVLNFGFETEGQFKSHGVITDFALLWKGIYNPEKVH